MVPVIDVFKCDGCGICVQKCPPQIMGLIKEKAALLVDLCEECGICAEVCPLGAVRFRLPNLGVQATHEAYVTRREARPHRGNWKTGVALGRGGDGKPK